MSQPITVAVDGPAAAGKGTLSRRLAVALDLPHLDTGLLYRAVARRMLDAGANPADPSAAEAAARALDAADLRRADLRGPVMDAASSKVATVPGVRAALLDFQRNFARTGAVLDGRDIGTVVLPNARVKLFVTASLATRARRRWAELQARGLPASLPQVEAEMAARDAQDSGRATAPLQAAADASLLDTTDLDADGAFAQALALVQARVAGNTPIQDTQ